MNNEHIHSPVIVVVDQFVDFFQPFFIQFSELMEKRKIKKSANIFVDVLINETKKKNITKFIEKDILENMPEGIWNVETIDLVEKKLDFLFNKDLIEKLKEDIPIEPKKKNYFLKYCLSNLLAMQINGIRSFQKQINFASVQEKEKINIRLGREISGTLKLINEKSEDMLKKIKETKDITTKSFSSYLKHFWIATTLLSLRISDIILAFNKNKNDTIKKMNYLGIERIRINSYC